MLGHRAAVVAAADDEPFDVEGQERSDDEDYTRDLGDELLQQSRLLMRQMH